MTTFWSYDFEAGVASGTAMTTTNSLFRNFVTGGAWTFSNTHLLAQGGGSLAGRCVSTGASVQANDNGHPWASQNVIYYRVYLYIEQVPSATTTVLNTRAPNGTGGLNTASELKITSTGQIQIKNNAATAVATSSTNLVAVGTYARVEGKLDVVNNQQQVKVFVNANVHGTIADYDSGLVASATGGVGITTFACGIINAATAIIHFDNLAFADSWLGPVVSTNQPPTCSAGSNQTVEPWSTVTLTGTAADSDGTIASSGWSQVSGTPVTYTVVNSNTVTFTAPVTIQGETASHKFTVTDNLGATANATTQVTTLAVTERAVLNGAETPARLMHVSASQAINPPSAPQNVQATVTGTGPYTVTITWTAPASNGGSAITGYNVTRITSPGGSHTGLAATATSDTWTNLTTAPPFTFSIVATNAAGAGTAANVTVGAASNQYRFPGDTLPLVTGKVLVGCTEGDNDGTQIWSGYEWVAPEADTGKKYSAIKIFYHGGSVESCFTPSTGGIAQDMKAEYVKGHIVLANIAIQQSNSSHFSTWRAAGNTADTTVMNTYYNFIQWVEEGSDVPNVPVMVCMPHEAQQPSKVSSVTSSGMTPGDYGDLQVAFRTAMDNYALAKVGGTDPTKYTWKRLSFGGVHTGEAFSVASTDVKCIDGFYTSYQNGGAAIAKRTHDWVGADQYQQPISGSTALGRTGVPQWNNVATKFVAWCQNKGYPMMWGEFGIRETDADAGAQLQDFWNHVISGSYDIFAILYFNSTAGALISTGANHWLFTNYILNDPANGGNSNFYDTWKSMMNDSHVARYWDLGYPKGF